MPKVVLLKSGNSLTVQPTDQKISNILTPRLSFTEEIFLRGWARTEAKRSGLPLIQFKQHNCYVRDVKNRIATAWGFWHKVKRLLSEAGYDVVVRDLMPHPHPEVYVPRWERLKQFGYELRPGQDEFLVELFSNPCGRFRCPPGYGKSTLIGFVGVLCPKATIDVVTKRVSVLRERIYPELCQMLPDVGIVGGGMNQTGHRVMLYTAGSAHHSPGTSDFLLCDEAHELVADEISQKMIRWTRSRNYGFSASHERLDHKEMRGEGIFGPIVYDMPYEEAQGHGMVVPIEIHWTPVVMDIDPAEDADDVRRKRLGLWTNGYRNGLIVQDAHRYDPDVQTLITCDVLEHAVHLKKLLPEFTLVHAENGMSFSERGRYIRDGYLQEDEPYMTSERRQELTHKFETGSLKKVICTTVWNVGVDFTKLQVLIRAGGGGSPVNDTQIPGRVSRVNVALGKTAGIVHDYMDQFDSSLRRHAKTREANYAAHGWKQHFPERVKKRSPIQRLLFDEPEPSRKRRHPPAR